MPQPSTGIHNRRGVPIRKSDGFVVAEKRGHSRGTKGPCRYHVEARGVSLPACRLYLRLRFFKGQAEARLRCEDKPSGTDGIKLCGRRISREPNAENPPVRFEEGGHSSNRAAVASTLRITSEQRRRRIKESAGMAGIFCRDTLPIRTYRPIAAAHRTVGCSH